MDRLPKIILEAPIFNYVKNDNIFEIGIRNFHENPFTDVLSYFLKKSSEYKFSKEFLIELFKPIGNDDLLISLSENNTVETQVVTENGNFIDLIIYNEEYILVLEIKIFHHLANPFSDYKTFIESKFPNNKKEFIILSYKNEIPPNDWLSINFRNQFDSFLNINLHTYDNKWDFFMLDFLNKYKNDKNYKMSTEEYNFYNDNYLKVIQANNTLNLFLKNVAENIINDVTVSKYKIEENWNESKERAIRFYPNTSKDNIVLTFNENGKFSINIYYYNNDSFKIHSKVGTKDYEKWEEQKVISCFSRKKDKEYENLEKAINELKTQIEIMYKYYS